MDKLFKEAQHWTSKLKEVSVSTASISAKLNMLPIPPLNREELEQLHENLRLYLLYTDLLDETMTSIANYKKPRKKLFWKK